jgi:hypothetical protein
MPGGRTRLMVLVTEAIWAMAAPMLVPCSKYTLTMPRLDSDCDSRREMPFTVVERARSVMKTTRLSMSSADRPG